MPFLTAYQFDFDMDLPNWTQIARDIMKLHELEYVESGEVFDFLPWGIIFHLDLFSGSETEGILTPTPWFPPILESALKGDAAQIHLMGDFNTRIHTLLELVE